MDLASLINNVRAECAAARPVGEDYTAVTLTSGTVNMVCGTVNMDSGTVNIDSGKVTIKNGTVNMKEGRVFIGRGTVNIIDQGTVVICSGTVNIANGNVYVRDVASPHGTGHGTVTVNGRRYRNDRRVKVTVRRWSIRSVTYRDAEQPVLEFASDEAAASVPAGDQRDSDASGDPRDADEMIGDPRDADEMTGDRGVANHDNAAGSSNRARAPTAVRGMLRSAIYRLPTRKFRSAPAGSGGTAARSVLGCLVCIADYRRGDVLRRLPCFHEFHLDCIDPWLKINASCPICRTQVDLSTQMGIL